MNSGKEYEFDRPYSKTVDISDFPSFTYNYVDMRFDLEDVLPLNKLLAIDAKLIITITIITICSAVIEHVNVVI